MNLQTHTYTYRNLLCTSSVFDAAQHAFDQNANPTKNIGHWPTQNEKSSHVNYSNVQRPNPTECKVLDDSQLICHHNLQLQHTHSPSHLQPVKMISEKQSTLLQTKATNTVDTVPMKSNLTFQSQFYRISIALCLLFGLEVGGFSTKWHMLLR